ARRWDASGASPRVCREQNYVRWCWGWSHLKASLPAVLRENPPYGMRGGIEETSASCEARYAPRSYPPGAAASPSLMDRVVRHHGAGEDRAGLVGVAHVGGAQHRVVEV